MSDIAKSRMLVIRFKTGERIVREANDYWIDEDSGELFVRLGKFISCLDADLISAIFWESDKKELPQIAELKRKKEGKSDA